MEKLHGNLYGTTEPSKLHMVRLMRVYEEGEQGWLEGGGGEHSGMCFERRERRCECDVRCFV